MAAKLLTNGTIISFEDSTQRLRILHKTSVLIEHDRVTGIATDLKDLVVPPNTDIIDVSGKIVSPGFTNTHSHMWQTAYRTMAPNCSLMEYFFWPSQRGTAYKSFTPVDVYISCLEGYLEALNAGVTCIVDHAHHNWDRTVFEPGYEAAIDSGARVWYCFAPAERETFSMNDQYAAIESLGMRGDNADALVTLGLAFDSIGSMDAQEIENTKDIIKKLDLKAITLHYVGGPWFGGADGTSPANLAKHKLQDLNIPIVFSHGGFVREADRAALREHDWNLSITPESEMHYGHGQATSKYVLDQASLGIDTNWTFSGDMITQSRTWLQHVRAEQYGQTLATGKIPRRCPFDVEEAFLLMTRQGGRAVRRDDVGVLKIGAKADLVVIDGDSPNMLGWTDPIAAVVLHANTGDIEHVIVDGEFRKRDRKLIPKKGDWKDISKKFAATARKIQSLNKDGRPELGENMMGMGLVNAEDLSTQPGGRGRQ